MHPLDKQVMLCVAKAISLALTCVVAVLIFAAVAGLR